MMLGIIAYGSLINPQETKGQREQPTHIVPVKLETFKRSFNQRPAWRKNTSKNSAVLNVQASEQNWLNAICYCYAEFNFTTLDHRERGYTRTSIPADKINSYQGQELPELDEAFIYSGKKEYRDSTLLPNPNYLEICLMGAKKWGESFYDDFLNTTHINNEILLREYLSTSGTYRT
ncbi:MAG: hypothetical protein QM483_07885 [Desulfuromusa sp.]